MKLHKTTLVTGLVLALGVTFSAQALAQQGQCGVERKVQVGALDEATWKRLNSVHEDVGEEKYNEAYADLSQMLTRAGSDKYLQAIINNSLAQVEWARENYPAALRHFEKTIELDALPNKQHFDLMYQVAQLYNMQDQQDKALEALDLWFCKVDPEQIKAPAYVLQASIYSSKEDWPQVLTSITKAIEMDDNPKEPWYQLKLAAHFELEQFPQAADTLEMIINRWPDKKIYWIQLAQTHYKLKRDAKALAVAALAYRKGLLDTKADVMFLSSLYSNEDVPYKAAEVLETGIEDGLVEPTQRNWTVVADAWYAAEELEKSLVAYQKAGAAALDGKIDLRRGFILIDLERWPDAKEALAAAIEKGGLSERQTGEAHLLKGMAEFNLGNQQAATQDWQRAMRYEQSRQAAQQWLNHQREEQARQAAA